MKPDDATYRLILFAALSIIIVVIVFSISVPLDDSFTTTVTNPQSSSSQGKVFVMYAASLLKIFENTLGPSFQNETGYTYEGEGRGYLYKLRI